MNNVAEKCQFDQCLEKCLRSTTISCHLSGFVLVWSHQVISIEMGWSLKHGVFNNSPGLVSKILVLMKSRNLMMRDVCLRWFVFQSLTKLKKQ